VEFAKGGTSEGGPGGQITLTIPLQTVSTVDLA